MYTVPDVIITFNSGGFMKKLVGLLAGVLLIFGVAGNASAASATTFTLDSYAVTLNTEDPGLKLYAHDILEKPTSWVLEAGDIIDVNLFTIGTTETTVNFWEDMKKFVINVEFTFSAPDALDDSVTGVTGGVWLIDTGYVLWDDPVEFTYGDGGSFLIGLTDSCFGTPGSATVSMTVDFKTASVPVPSTILLLSSGLLGLVGFNRKRK